MKKELNIKLDYKNLIIGAVLQIIITLVTIIVFSLIMYFFETEDKYSPLFASISLAAGAFANSFFISAKKREKGYLYGMTIGFITFVLVTITGIIINSGSFTLNTFFHLVIIMLSAILGGILGVNKKKQSYI